MLALQHLVMMGFLLFAGSADGASLLDGRWIGDGTLLDQRDRTRDCGKVEVEITLTQAELLFPNGLDNCQVVSNFIEPTRFQIEDGTLLFKGTPVGTIQGSKIRVEYTNTLDEFKELLELELDNDVFYYRDTISLFDDSGSVTIKATLEKRDNNRSPLLRSELE